MKASHVMVSPVITGTPDMTVREVARLLCEHRISAIPVVDDGGEVIGIISEGDLIRRAEIGTQKQRSWWLSIFTSNIQLAEEYAKAHAEKVADLMTYEVISAEPETPLSDIARLFEQHNVKRVPIVKDKKLVGIVTRSNLVQAIATAPQKLHKPLSDDAIREKILQRLRKEFWANVETLNVAVEHGAVHLWGIVRSDAERNAIRVAVEGIAGVKTVDNNLALESMPAWI
jgi:CBS domain-containing protein